MLWMLKSTSRNIPILFVVFLILLSSFITRYISAAQDWVAWVNTLPDQRCEFYKDTVYDPQKAQDVQAELRKINCFNCHVPH